MTAALAPCIRPVDASFWCGAQPGRRYWADCYRRACDYLLAHSPGGGPCAPIDGLLLVHGTCGDGRLRWAHAWVDLPGALVFDGVRQQFYDWQGYAGVLRATAEAGYAADATREQMRATGHYGPWHQGRLGHDSVRHLETPAGAP